MRKGVDPVAEAAGKQVAPAETASGGDRPRTRALTRGKQTLREQEAALRPGAGEAAKPEDKDGPKEGAKDAVGKDPRASAGDKGVDPSVPENFLRGVALRRYNGVIRLASGTPEAMPLEVLEDRLVIGNMVMGHPSLTPALRLRLEQAMQKIRMVIMRMREGG